MEKKFKNKVAFTGPIPLRKAMVEELLKIGYKWESVVKNDYANYDYTISPYDDDSPNGHLGNYSDLFKHTLYLLPEQWDECLKAASEVEEEFVLPEKWCVKVTNKNVSTLDIWRKQQYKYNKNSVPLDRYLVNDPWSDKSYCSYTVDLPKVNKDYTEINFEQFKKYVLKQDNTMSKLEDFTIEGSIPLKKAFVEEGNFSFYRTTSTSNWRYIHPSNDVKNEFYGTDNKYGKHFILPQQWNEAMEYAKKYFNQTITKEYDLCNGYKAIVDTPYIRIDGKGKVTIEEFIEWFDNNWYSEECDDLADWKVKSNCKIDIGCIKGINGEVISQIYEDLTNK